MQGEGRELDKNDGCKARSRNATTHHGFIPTTLTLVELLLAQLRWLPGVANLGRSGFDGGDAKRERLQLQVQPRGAAHHELGLRHPQLLEDVLARARLKCFFLSGCGRNGTLVNGNMD